MRALKLSLDECELSGETWDLHLHHVLFRSKGGDDCRANIVCMTRSLHEAYHRGEAEAMRKLGDHVKLVRMDTVEYLIEKLGFGGYKQWAKRHEGEER